MVTFLATAGAMGSWGHSEQRVADWFEWGPHLQERRERSKHAFAQSLKLCARNLQLCTCAAWPHRPRAHGITMILHLGHCLADMLSGKCMHSSLASPSCEDFAQSSADSLTPWLRQQCHARLASLSWSLLQPRQRNMTLTDSMHTLGNEAAVVSNCKCS